MSGDVPTAVGLPVLGAVLLAIGWWSRGHLDVLVGTIGSADLLDRRRRVLRRGVVATIVAGAVLLVGGIVAAVVILI